MVPKVLRFEREFFLVIYVVYTIPTMLVLTNLYQA